MIRYTTPTIPLVVEGKDLTDNLDVYVTLEQEVNRVELTKCGTDLILTTTTHEQTTDTNVSFTLTQEETAMFNLRASVSVQVNWIDASGIRGATEIKTIPVMRNLLDKVIEYGN